MKTLKPTVVFFRYVGSNSVIIRDITNQEALVKPVSFFDDVRCRNSNHILTKSSRFLCCVKVAFRNGIQTITRVRDPTQIIDKVFRNTEMIDISVRRGTIALRSLHNLTRVAMTGIFVGRSCTKQNIDSQTGKNYRVRSGHLTFLFSMSTWNPAELTTSWSC